MRYRKHVFVCTNDRTDGRKSCGSEFGMQLVNELKNQILERGLQIEVRAQKAGCFDICGFGPAVVVYPDATFYGKVSLDDLKEIVESHLINNKPVERLVVKFPPHLRFLDQQQ